MPSDQSNDLARKLAILYEIGRELSALRDPDVLLQQVARLTERLVDYRTFAVLLVGPDGRLAPRLTIGLDKEFLDRLPTAMDEGHLRTLARLQKPLLIQGMLSHTLRGLLEDHPELRSEVLLP